MTVEAVSERILIVDDDESFCRSLQLILKKTGYCPETAMSAEEAIKKAGEKSYRVALLDIRLPDMQGLELLTHLSEMHSDMDMILITGYASVETALAAVKTKAAAYITKPIDMQELLDTIERIMERQSLIQDKEFAENALRRSEERYRTLVDSMHDLVFVYDENDCYSQYHALSSDLLYMMPEKFIGKHVSEVLPKEIALEIQEKLQQVRITGESRTIDYPLEIRGNDHWFSANLSLHEDKKSVVAVVRDITERKKVEVALLKSQERLVEAQRIAHLGNWDWDIERNILAWSDEIYRIFGTTPQEFEATYETFLTFIHPDDRDQVTKAIDRALNEGANYAIDHRIIRSDGSERTVHEQGIVLSADDGTPMRMIGTVQDITERRNVEINNIAIAETSKLYLDIMGHDIRNHLQAIIMSSDIIENNDIGDEVTSAIEMIVESVQKSKDLISKVHADKELLNVPLSDISLTVALEHSINSLLEVYDDIKINVEYNVQESLITADKYVERLLSNILENAVIHNSEAIKQIWVELHEVDRGYLVSIKDNGPGISEGMKETLFDPSRRFGGIGVHQVIRILRKYGGNISVHDRVPSDSSQGARFDIWFPKALTSV